MTPQKRLDLFKEFLSKNEILIVDKSSASRRRLTKTLVDMGSKRHQVHSVAHFSEAEDIIKNNKPQLVLSDYAINGGSGFDLFKKYRELFPQDKTATLVLITSNISQSAVAKAAEEDVDSFIIKPYTVKSLEKSLVNAVINKLFPSEYVQVIEKGKELMFAGHYDEALLKFEEALSLNKKPALAHFYHGQVKYFLENSEDAQQDYKQGLAINSIHFKCQVGLYDLFKKEGKVKEAYDIVRNIAKYFPANPERLKEVVRLCMITENYEHMEEYYNIFIELEERTEDVLNFICSGLYIYGKYLFINGNKIKARDIFDKNAITCMGKVKFLHAMIVELIKNEIYDDAQKIVGRIPSGSEFKNDYDVANYLAYSNSMSATELVSLGLEIFNKGKRDPICTRILIDALKKTGSDKKAQEYEEEAQHLWPDIFKKTKQAA
jgi:CheY-like chemotaxis protein